MAGKLLGGLLHIFVACGIGVMLAEMAEVRRTLLQLSAESTKKLIIEKK